MRYHISSTHIPIEEVRHPLLSLTIYEGYCDETSGLYMVGGGSTVLPNSIGYCRILSELYKPSLPMDEFVGVIGQFLLSGATLLDESRRYYFEFLLPKFGAK